MRIAAILTIFFLSVLVILFIGTINSMNEAQQLCEKHTPKTMLLTSAITTSLSGDRRCDYESQPQEPYYTCAKLFTKTEHHGKFLTLNTCPGGI